MLRDKEYAERPNKTQLKEVTKYQHDIGKQLIEMANSKLLKIPMSDRLRAAILDGKKFKKGALKRQLKFITSLMYDEDVEAIDVAIKHQDLPNKQEIEAFHQLEEWRDGLILGDNDVMNNVMQQFANINRQHLLQLIRNAGKEAKLNKPPKSSRALFQYLKELQEA